MADCGPAAFGSRPGQSGRFSAAIGRPECAHSCRAEFGRGMSGLCEYPPFIPKLRARAAAQSAARASRRAAMAANVASRAAFACAAT